MAEIFFRINSQTAAKPCYVEMAKKAQNSTLIYNKVTFIASIFNISSVKNVSVMNEYKITSPTKPMRTENNIIYLNDAYLGNTSQEYFVAAFLHELIHNYIGVSSTEQLDHDDMSYNYFTPMKEILVSIFPNLGPNSTDPNAAYKLEALAWNGLNETRAYEEKGEAWGAAQSGWLNDFRNGTVGTTNCP